MFSDGSLVVSFAKFVAAAGIWWTKSELRIPCKISEIYLLFVITLVHPQSVGINMMSAAWSYLLLCTKRRTVSGWMRTWRIWELFSENVVVHFKCSLYYFHFVSQYRSQHPDCCCWSLQLLQCFTIPALLAGDFTNKNMYIWQTKLKISHF